MKKIGIVILVLHSVSGFAQTDSLKALQEIATFQKELNDEYRDKATSPLEDKDRRKFKGHRFYPPNLAYRVKAKLIVTEGTPFFPMKTTTAQMKSDRIYGYVEFDVAGSHFRMPVYQSQDLMKTTEYADYLFFPFTDLTNGKETYMGGRYIDLRIPVSGDTLVIDFNRAYNPYCAYSHRYSCPLVPAENQMDVAIPAGVRLGDREIGG
jgi:uncharacterized protein (DUF1684 family)